MNKEQKGYYLVTLAIITLVFFYLVNDYVFRTFENISVANVVFWGWLGANIALSPVFLSTKNSRKKLKNEIFTHGKLALIVSILTSIGGFLWFLAISESSSGIMSLLEKSNILFVFLLGIIFLQEKVSAKELLSVGIAIIGLFLIANLEGEVSRLGVFAILCGQFLYSVQSFLIKKFGGKMNSFFFSYVRSVLMLIFTGIFFGILGKIELIPMKVFLILTGSQIFGVFISRYLYFEAHKFFPISKLSFLMLAESILVLLGAYFVFGDIITIEKIIGASLIVVGLAFFLKEQGKTKAEKK